MSAHASTAPALKHVRVYGDCSYGVCTGFFLKNSMFLLLTGVSLSATKHFTHTFEASPTGVWAPSGKGCCSELSDLKGLLRGS
jgi:hypothetical protein